MPNYFINLIKEEMTKRLFYAAVCKIFDKPTKGLDNSTEFEPEPEPEPVNPTLFENIILTEICGEQKYVEIYNKGSEEVSLVGLILERNEGASSYSRQDNSTWVYADFTPGAVNGEKVKEIINPNYTAQ